MITREKGSRNVVFNCDGCSEIEDTETDDFTDAVSIVKRAGWTIIKDDDEWMHWCPVCADK
jgi:hypothetical protein